MQIHPTLPVTLKSKFRGCILGAIVGDCMGARFDKSPAPLAYVANRIEPASLRNQIPRNGGRFLFPFGVDSLMIFAASEVLRDHISRRSDQSMLQTHMFEKLQAVLERQNQSSSSIQWGVGTRHVLENAGAVDSNKLRTNCGITRALVSGLVDAERTAEPICAATHTHQMAVNGAKTIARAVNIGVSENRALIPTDLDDISSYASLVDKAHNLATFAPYDEQDEFEMNLQDRFAARFGRDASSHCSVAASLFALYRTIHSLPHLDASSEAYIARIKEVSRAGAAKEKKGLSLNTLGNSNRLDTAGMFSGLTPSIEQDLPVALSVAWGISVGGDVRSNACLAGGLAGSIWGEEGIPPEWLMFCEGVELGREVADSLYDLVADKN